MGKFKYNPGDQIGPKDILFISRDFNKGQGNWYGTFECPLCKKHFQAKVKNVSSGSTTSCGCKSNKKNIIGEINSLGYEIVGEINKEHSRNAYWKCRCNKCASLFEITTTDFHRGINRCPVCSVKSHRGRSPEDLSGKKFNMLTAIEYDGNQKWKCRCDCGNIAYVRSDSLKNGSTTSCGCILSKGEQKIGSILQELQISYVTQKTFDTCRFPDTNSLARFDFYIPEKNIVIEYNGIQHYEYRDSGWNTQSHFSETVERDMFKKKWCEQNGIKMIVIPYSDFSQINKQYISSLISTN